MKIFFEDGALRLAKAPIVAIAHVDAQNGATDCYNKLKQVKDKYGKKASAYTNSETALLNAAELSWNEEKKEFDIFLRRQDGRWAKIQTLTPRELRQGHNIWKLWWSGEFEEKQIEIELKYPEKDYNGAPLIECPELYLSKEDHERIASEILSVLETEEK